MALLQNARNKKNKKKKGHYKHVIIINDSILNFMKNPNFSTTNVHTCYNVKEKEGSFVMMAIKKPTFTYTYT